MNIENEIFKKSVIEYNKLINYGFSKIDNKYTISKNILNNSFRIDIEIKDNGEVIGKIFDLSFEEEYKNFRIENQVGEFVNSVRKEFENFLIDIRNNCTTSSYFIFNQSNRIANLIIEKFGNTPEFLWERNPGYGIFRNQKNNKWYAAILNIDKSKIDKKSNGEIEILNVKLDENKVKELLKKPGFFKAYHMNKEKWITIILNDTISDDEIMNYISESRLFTEKKK